MRSPAGIKLSKDQRAGLNGMSHEDAATARGLKGARRWLARKPDEGDPRTAMARAFIAKHDPPVEQAADFDWLEGDDAAFFENAGIEIPGNK